MIELTILELSEIREERQLEVIKSRGTRTAITDFAILLGGYVLDYYTVDRSGKLEERTGYYWTKTEDNKGGVWIIGPDDCKYMRNNTARNVSIRPALSFSSAVSNLKHITKEKLHARIFEIEYGYYPRSAVSKEKQELLETLYINSELKLTDNSYTTDSRKYYEYDKFEPTTHVEYEYNGKRYIRVQISSLNYRDKITLSNGETYKQGDVVWVEVQPVKWLVDLTADKMVTKELIVSGIQLLYKGDYRANFCKTNLYDFMNTYLSKELFQIQNMEINETISQETPCTNEEEQLSNLIEKLYKKGYSAEQILFHTADTLKKLSNTSQNTSIYQKTKHL